MPRCKVHHCKTNISMLVDGEDVTVTLDVEFEVEPPDPDVGIMGCSIADFTAKVIAVEDQVFPALLAKTQAKLDADVEHWRDEIDEACLDSLCEEPN